MPTPNTPLDEAALAEIEKRSKAAVPGPWKAVLFADGDYGVNCSSDGWPVARKMLATDAVLVAESREYVPALLATVRHHRDEAERQSARVDEATAEVADCQMRMQECSELVRQAAAVVAESEAVLTKEAARADALQAEVEALRAPWIPVSERLPRAAQPNGEDHLIGDAVLVLRGTGYWIAQRKQRRDTPGDGSEWLFPEVQPLGAWYFGGRYNSETDVLPNDRWQPLPPPPSP